MMSHSAARSRSYFDLGLVGDDDDDGDEEGEDDEDEDEEPVVG